jgi:hypothetical protein
MLATATHRKFQAIMSNEPSTRNEKLGKDLKNVLERINICWYFLRHLDKESLQELNLTAKTVGESEKYSVTRLVAHHRIQILFKHTSESHNASEFESHLQTKYGYVINMDLLQVYLVFEFGKLWVQKSDLEWLNRCVMTAGIISSFNLKNSVLISTFSQLFSTKLENIVAVLEKARRVPNDVIFTRMCGMDIPTVKNFLDLCLSLLEFIQEDEYTTNSCMVKAIEDAMRLSTKETVRKKSYYDDAVGIMLETLQSATERRLSSSLIQSHIHMIQVLQFIFKLDMKNIRPLKLFPTYIHFCSSLFESPLNVLEKSAMTNTSKEKLKQERLPFTTKVYEDLKIDCKDLFGWE